MIPVTAFAGKKVARLRAGALRAVRRGALMAGGAEVVAWDDNEKSAAEAQAAGLDDAGPARARLVDDRRAGAGAGRAAHPSRAAWSVDARAQGRRRVIGDIELFCRERADVGRRKPARRHHRHQRQIDHHRADRPYPDSAGLDAQMGGNIGMPVLELEPLAPGPRLCAGMSSFQIDLAPSLHADVGILLNVTPDHLDRHGSMENYAAVKERLLAQVQKDGTAVVGVDDRWTRDRPPTASSAPARQSCAVSVGKVLLARGVFARWRASATRQAARRTPVARARRHRARCAARTMGRTRPARDRRLRLRSASNCAAIAERARDVSRPRASHGGGRPQRATCCSSTIPRRPTPMPRPRRWRASAIFSGSPAASRRPAASRACAEFFPRIRKAYLIGEAADDFAATLDGKVPYEIAGTLDGAVDAAARDAASLRRSRSRWCCCRRPAPRSTSSRISSCAARPSSTWCGDPGNYASSTRVMVREGGRSRSAALRMLRSRE